MFLAFTILKFINGEFEIGSTNNPHIDIVLNSRYLSALYIILIT